MNDREIPLLEDLKTLQLKRGEILLGTLQVRNLDMPWVICAFEATEAFDDVRSLFDEELKMVDKDDMDDWEKAYQRIEELGLVLVDVEGGKSITEFLLHVHGNEARFRY